MTTKKDILNDLVKYLDNKHAECYNPRADIALDYLRAYVEVHEELDRLVGNEKKEDVAEAPAVVVENAGGTE